jgi:membrane dipeptidase
MPFTPDPFMISRRLFLATSAALASSPTLAKSRPPKNTQARTIHEHLLCLDTHLDTPLSFARPGWDMMQRHSVDADFSQVDYPRMVDGGLDGGFFAIYTPQGPLTPEGMMAARDAALVRAAKIREMVARNSSHFELALVPTDAPRIAAKGKRIVFQSIENSYPLANDVTLLRSFYALGVRMAGPVHFANNQLGDSATDPKGKTWNGLSPMGHDFVALANELGIILDASHSSDDVFDQMLALSKVPIILSHSGCRSVHDHPRNIDDDRLKKLARSGGVIQINSFNAYLVTVPSNPERDKQEAAIFAALRGLPTLSPVDATKAIASAASQMRELNQKYPVPRATFDDYMAHMLHALKLVGSDHVGVGADWDGGGGVIGIEDCASNWKITARLLQEGYKIEDLQKIWSGNVLRLMQTVQDARTSARPPSPPTGGGE